MSSSNSNHLISNMIGVKEHYGRERSCGGCGRISSNRGGGGGPSASPRVMRTSERLAGGLRQRYSNVSPSGSYEKIRRRHHHQAAGSREVLRRALMPPTRRPSLRWCNFRPTPSRLCNMSMAP